MLFQIATFFAFVLALVARKPFNVDVVLVGKMSFQIATLYRFVLAHVARLPFTSISLTLARCFFKP